MKIDRSAAKTSAATPGALTPPAENPGSGPTTGAETAMRWPIRDGWSTVLGTTATAGFAFALMGVCAVVGASLAPPAGPLEDPLATASAATPGPLTYTAPAPSAVTFEDLGLSVISPTAPAPLTALVDEAPSATELFGDSAN